jgi:transposase
MEPQLLSSKTVRGKQRSAHFWERYVRAVNPERKIVVILDNFRSHHAKDTVPCAAECGIELLYLPPYSLDLNPLEFIWKSIKRVISQTFIVDLTHLKWLIRKHFEEFSSRLSFAQVHRDGLRSFSTSVLSMDCLVSDYNRIERLQDKNLTVVANLL